MVCFQWSSIGECSVSCYPLLLVVIRNLLKDSSITVGLAHTEKRKALNSVSIESNGFWDLWEPVPNLALNLCLCMLCSVGILPPTAGSCSPDLAHIITPTPPHAVHGSYCLSSPPTHTDLGIHHLTCMSGPELTAIGWLWKRWFAEAEPSKSLTGPATEVSDVRSPPLVESGSTQWTSSISSPPTLDLE